MSTVTIDGSNYTVYANVAEATVFLQADLGLADTWATAANPEAALVTATRYLDRQRWQGTPTGATVWPRSGVVDKFGNSVSDATVPAQIVDACCILAATFISDPSLASKVDQGNNIREVQAGTARVAYFRPTSVLSGSASKLPAAVQDLIGQFLSVGAVDGGTAFGTDGCSSFTDSNPYGTTGGGIA